MLSKRLNAIASLVNKNSVVADIGSDHGLLPCFLAQNNLVIKAYAVDNKEGPLNSAVENINKYNLDDKVFPILADGLNNLNQDVNSVVIAGMGFMTIKTILEANIDVIKKLDQVIVSTHTQVVSLRKWIMEKAYLIEDEVMVYENNKFYTIISFNPKNNLTYKESDYLISKILIDKKDNIYLEYLKERLSKLVEINKYQNSDKLAFEIEKINLTLKRSE